MSPIKIHGWDVSLNHGAFVELVDGKLSNFWYYTDTASSAERGKEHGFRLKLPDHDDRQVRSIHRLAWLENFIDKKILMPNMPDYIGLEDYAIRAEQGAHYLGEIGGIARILTWFRGVKLRLHDPTSVKMFVAHDGTCQKDLIERSVAKRWGQDFSKFNPPPPKREGQKQNRRTSEDLADAYGIAMMVWTEVLLRSGDLTMNKLHEKEVRVFNRVTKTYPINLLDRDWIANPEGVKTTHGEPVCSVCGSRKCCLAKKPKVEAK